MTAGSLVNATQTVWKRCVVALAAALPCATAAPLSAAPLTDVYATFVTYTQVEGYRYGFGTFNLANPTGAPGAYAYAWTMLLSPTNQSLNVVARNSDTGAMVLQYGDTEFRSISTGGALSGNLGSTPTYWGMAFDGSGGLFAYNAYSEVPEWRRLDPANGQTLTVGALTGEVPAPYSSGGGNLAPRPAGGGFYYLNQAPDPELVRFIPAGNDVATVLTGTFAGAGFDPENMAVSLFASGSSLYLLQAASLFAVDESTAALTKLGTVTGMPVEFTGFSGAAGMIAAVPEPSTWAMGAGGLACAAWGAWRRRKRAAKHGPVARPV